MGLESLVKLGPFDYPTPIKIVSAIIAVSLLHFNGMAYMCKYLQPNEKTYNFIAILSYRDSDGY